MSFKMQSKFVGRSDTTNQSASSDDSFQDGDQNVIYCSNNLNLPTQSYKTAEYLGLRTGYSVYRQTSPKVEKPKASKRKYDCPIFESESPVEPFSSLPHPNDLFGKRSRKESSKKKRVQVNPVHYHSMQLHRKQAKLNLVTSDQHEISVRESKNHGLDTTNAHTSTALPNQLDSSLQNTSHTDFNINSYKQFPNTFGNEFNFTMTNQIEIIKSTTHFPFSFKTNSKIFEE